MKLTETININTYLAYKQPESLEPSRKIKSENLEWDYNHPKSLTSLCIEKISENWSGNLSAVIITILRNISYNPFL